MDKETNQDKKSQTIPISVENVENEISKNHTYGSGYRSSSWFIVINQKTMETLDITYEKIPDFLQDNFKTLLYACWDEEIGDKGNQHLHIYMELGSKVRFTTIKKFFEGAHIERRYGSPLEARTYVEKPHGVLFKGKEKSHTVVKPFQELGNFEPFRHKKGYRKEQELQLTTQEKFEYIMANFTTYEEIRDWDIHFATMHRVNLMQALNEKSKQTFIEKHCTVTKNIFGDTVTTVNRGVYYLHGESRTGKTFGVMKKWGDRNVSVIGNLHEDMKMDKYNNTPVMVLDEYYSQFKLDTVLGILDDKLIELDCRYSNRLNLAHTIVLTSNWTFEKQYSNAQKENPIAYKAFKNRFTGGCWELWKSSNGIRYLACEWGYNPAYGAPIDIFDDSMRVVTKEQLKRIKNMPEKFCIKLPRKISDSVLDKLEEEYMKNLPF